MGVDDPENKFVLLIMFDVYYMEGPGHSPGVRKTNKLLKVTLIG